MYGLSYIWHAEVLNDFLKIPYPINLYLTVSAVVYLGIGLIITVLTYAAKKMKDSFKYGIAIGAIIGVFIYAIAFVFGVSFSTTFDIKYIAVDAVWQAFEQSFGGLICGWVYRTLYMRDKRASLAT
jgi:uncharacterized membrane protein YesL